MPGLPIVFFILAVVAVATAIGTIISRNAVYSALLLVLNFATIAVLYLMLGAPFIALSQITVYAGSIMVLFLFVIMLLGAERLPEGQTLRWQPLLGIPLALILAADFAYDLFQHVGNLSGGTPSADFGTPKAVGELLFSQWMLPFEITAVILLVAVVGAVMLAKPDRPSPRPTPGQFVRGADPYLKPPAGAKSEESRQVPAGEQESAIKSKPVG